MQALDTVRARNSILSPLLATAFYGRNRQLTSIPQTPDLNRKAWEKLETYCRRFVKKRVHAYDICGPTAVVGASGEGETNSIGETRKITVPAYCWKIVVIAGANGKPDLSKTIAVIMPNKVAEGEDWKPYKATVKEVEKLTGYKFFQKQATKTDLEKLVRRVVCQIPLQVIEWKSADPKANTGSNAGETVSVEQFLGPKAKPEKWHGEEEKRQVRGFKALKTYIEMNLTETAVHKIGTVEKDVYIVGNAGDGKWVGVQTKVVET